MTIPKSHLVLLAIVAIAFSWSAVRPSSYISWTAEILPAAIAVIVCIVTYRRFRFTTLSYSIIALLSILTFIGGHYTYAEVPLFNWLQEQFSWQRNHYDRLGHFCKGFAVIMIRELFTAFQLVKRGWTLTILAITTILAVAASYEIIEWLSTLFPIEQQSQDDFLGMQGDKWDAQWDMVLAFSGAVVASLVHHLKLKK